MNPLPTPHRFIGLLALAAALLMVNSATSRADQVTLSAERDTTLYETPPGVGNGSGAYFFAGRTNGGSGRRGLIRFDTSAIPAGSTVTSVSLSLFMSRTTAPSYPVRLHRALAAWGEGAADADGNEGGGTGAEFDDATWVYRSFFTQTWTTPGGDYVAGTSATTSVGGVGTYTWNGAGMAADVSAWVNDPAVNHGWFVIGEESTTRTAKRFNAHESGGTGPQLTIDFTPPAVVGQCCLDSGDCILAASAACVGSYGGDGSTCVGDPCPDPSGACCFENETCATQTPSSCAGGGGVYHGNGVACTAELCNEPDGACCFDNGTCAIRSSLQCTAELGDYAGNTTVCGPAACPAGACCFGEDCFFLSPTACTGFGGDYAGDATTCMPNACAGCVDVDLCADADANMVRDDNCRWWECAAGACMATDITFADLGGSFGSCPPDGFANVHDRNHALTCFAGTNGCEPLNLDAGGAFGVCPPDGFCNIHDANHVLNAFAGSSSCACPGGAAPTGPVVAVDQARLIVIPAAAAVEPGGEVQVHVRFDGRAPVLRSYQLEVVVSGGTAGGLELLDVAILPRKDAVFAATDHFAAFNVGRGQMLAGLDADRGVRVPDDAYLATFTYRAARNASGAFVVDVPHDPDAQTFLVAPGDAAVGVVGSTPAVIDVQPRLRRPRR